MQKKEELMDSLVALCKRRGFIFQGSEIYGGLAGTWDYGPYGVALKNNVKKLWWKRFVDDRDDMYGVDAAILMNQRTWEASGHVSGFSDPMVECNKCGSKFRRDQLPYEMNYESDILCTKCGAVLGDTKQFNMMFKTFVGPSSHEEIKKAHPTSSPADRLLNPFTYSISYDPNSVSYLRPETAQGMFVNFKNILDTFHPKLPFGMAQMGKAFRNEIAPRDFLFRAREFEQMEIEYFVNPKDWKETFEHFVEQVHAFNADVGLDRKKVHELEVADSDRAFYSKRTIDFEFDFPFGRKELYGLAYRTDYDLKQHSEYSKVDLSYYDEETKERFIPHCIEPSFGLDRTILAILSDAYTEDEMGGEKRTYLKLAPSVAPVRVAVFPLLKNKPELVKKAKEVFTILKKEFGAVEFDDNGNIGKRYRRQDEIGTPHCVTVDFDTLEKGMGVTVRDRDTGKQERVGENELVRYLSR